MAKRIVQTPEDAKVLDDTELLEEFSIFEPKVALEKLKKYLQVYKEFDLGHLNEAEMKEFLKDGKAFFFGRDKCGNPCLIIKAKMMFVSNENMRQYVHMLYYNLSIGKRLAKA